MLMINVSYLSAQDPHFTQYYANPLYLNPAFAGTQVCPRLIFNYRNQWPQLSGTFVTYNASYDQHIDGITGGLGFYVLSDRAGQGTINTVSYNGIYSYRLVVNRSLSIKAGLQLGYQEKKLDWGKLTFGDQIDPKDGFIYNTSEVQPPLKKGYVDFSAGFLVYSESMFLGFAAHHLTEPEEGFINEGKLPMKITVHAGGIIPFEKRRRGKRKITDPSFSPNILYMQQRDFQQINYGFYINKYPLVGGLWYRQSTQNSDAFIALIGFQQSMFKIGYSYDLTVSKLSNASGGSHEISFAWQFDCRPKKKKLRAISCPSF